MDRFGGFGMLSLPLGVQKVIEHPVQPSIKNPLGIRGGLGPENVTVLIEGIYAYIRTPYDEARDLVQKIKVFDGDSIVGDNRPFNFTETRLIPNTNTSDTASNIMASGVQIHAVTDSAAPMRYQNTYMGGNHGASFVKTVTVASHDKTVEDVGSTWANDGVNFTLLYIESATKLWLMSANTGASAEKWSFDTTLSGNFTHVSGATHTDDIAVSSSTTTALEPAIKNQTKKLCLNGNNETSADGLYTCRFLTVVNNYQIVNPVSAIASVVAAVGSETQPLLNNGDAQITIELTHTFDQYGGCKIDVMHYYDQLVDVGLEQMGLQAERLVIGTYDNIYAYIPKTLPITVGATEYTFTGLQDFSADPSAAINLTTTYWADADHPPFRFLQFIGNGVDGLDASFQQMYAPDVGVAVDSIRKTLTTNACQISIGRKTYPYINYGTAGDVAAGTTYTAVSFRGYSKPGKYSSNADAVFFFQVGNVWYLTVDYHKICDHDQLSLPAPLRFKTVEQLDVHADVTVHAAVTDGIGIQISCAGTYGYAVLKLS